VAEGINVAAWAKMLGWPLIGDVLSQTGQPLPCADLWLANKAADCLRQAEIVIQFGGHLTGKRVLQWQAACQAEEYWLVDPSAGRLDPAHHRGRRLVAEISCWLDNHPAQSAVSWAPQLQALATETLRQAEAQTEIFGEAQVAQRIGQLLPAEGQLFVGNSLVVRLIDALTQLPAGYPVFGNRGASGIDGLISTAAGVHRASKRATLAIIGDLSALYDMNSLALLRDTSAPLVLLVVNNNGGQIFSMLPTVAESRERFYTMPQNVDFSHAAAMFGLTYQQPSHWDALQSAVDEAWQHAGTTLIEVIVEPTAGVDCLKQLLARVEAA
jgi:2-succinyl-5-enolpyruvyl-6-hydroxy-3-cyclohexene-1-carboxylate synthase